MSAASNEDSFVIDMATITAALQERYITHLLLCEDGELRGKATPSHQDHSGKVGVCVCLCVPCPTDMLPRGVLLICVMLC